MPEVPEAPDERAVPVRAYVVVVAAAVLVQMFWARTVFLFSDDYIFLTQGLHAELTWDYLKEPLFGHFSPVSRLTDLLVAPAIHDRPEIIYLVLVGAAAAVVAATAFLMTGALGRTRLALLGTALVGTSLTIVPLTNWYTAGVNILPALTGAFVCFGASVRLLRSPRWWWTVLAVLGYLLAVLSWELAAIIPLYVVVWAVLFRSRIGNPSYGAMLRRGAVAWVALVLIAVAVAVNYLGGYYAAQPSGSVWEIGAAVAVSLVQTLVPLAMGVYPASWGVLGVFVPVLTAVLLAILVRASLRRDRQAWRGWTFAVVGWLVPAVALVLSRVGIFGVSVAQQPMYFLLPVTLATLGALLAWSPTQPPQPRNWRTRRNRRRLASRSAADGWPWSPSSSSGSVTSSAARPSSTPSSRMRWASTARRTPTTWTTSSPRWTGSARDLPSACSTGTSRAASSPRRSPPTTGSAPCWTCMRRTWPSTPPRPPGTSRTAPGS